MPMRRAQGWPLHIHSAQGLPWQSEAAGTPLQGRACMPVGVGGSLAATALAAAASGAFLTGGGGGGRSGEGSGSSTLTLRQATAPQCHWP